MPVIQLENPTPVLPSQPVFPSAAVSITPSDVDTFSAPVTVYVGGAGDVAVSPWAGGANVVFRGLPAGQKVPVRVKAVLGAGAGTTATNLIAVY